MTSEDSRIVRTWNATATPEGAREYHRYFAGTLLPQLRGLPGFDGAYLLSRDVDGRVELTAHTIWASLDAIRAFAGEAALTASVVEPEARAVLLDFDREVVHRTVLIAPGPIPA